MHYLSMGVAERARPQDADVTDPAARVAVIRAELELLAAQAAASTPPNPRSSEFVRSIIAARSLRRKYLNSHLFADPAWDILLELYALEREGRRTSVSKLCLASGVPATTAIRWIDKLVHEDLIVRTEDPVDARRVWVTITCAGREAMDGYLKELSAGRLPL
jgi:DNA-binding MarR family transcriptional regulator